MIAQIIIGLIVLVIISAAVFALYSSLHSTATSSSTQQYVLNLRGKVDQVFVSNPKFTGLTTIKAVHGGIFSTAVANTLSSGKVTAPAGFTVKLGTVFGENNQWTMRLDNVNQSQCATLAATFTGPGVVRIATNGNAMSNPAYSSVFSQNSSATWPPSTATLIGSCHKGTNTIKWTFTD